jgi:16S rRNA (adenine1518-N6/adenine1519-N6)-dimethyltransferase
MAELRSEPAHVDPRTVLKRHGLRPNPRFSQNFLVSERVHDLVANAIEAPPGARVTEIGPGVGTLSRALLRRGYSVLAIEADPAMVAILRDELAGHAFEVVHGDATEIELPEGHIAGNLPYSVTGAFFRRFVESRGVAGAVVMVQREVRDRLMSPPAAKTYGALTVFVQAAFEVESIAPVPASAFVPPPKVSSSVVRLRRRAIARANETDAFRAVVRAAFDARRKTLKNALTVKLGTERAATALEATSIDPMRRGETLSVEEFGRLAAALEPFAEPG